MAVVNLTSESFDEEVLLSGKTVLVDFYADWCGACRMVSPIVEEISEEREDTKVCKVNVDSEPALAARFSVSSIPALMVFKEGKAVRSEVGAAPKKAILSMLE